MVTKPGEVYMVDLGIGGKVRPMVIVSREDPAAPRALSLCVPLTTQFRNSRYEVQLPRVSFLHELSYANIQGMQAIQHHELVGPIGHFGRDTLLRIRDALRYALELPA